MGAMKVWRMGDKVGDVAEKVKLRRDPSWKDSSGVKEIWKQSDRREVHNGLTWS